MRVLTLAEGPTGLKSWLRWCAVVGGSAAILLGLLVMVGWHAGSRALVQVLPGFVPMQYNTALGFVLCGAALVGTVFQRSRIARIAGGTAALIGLLTLVEYVAGIDLGIDQLLMEHDITVETSQPGRMAPNTAICFALIGLGAGIPGWHRLGSRRSMVMVVAASLALGLAMVALSGYFTHLETAYGWGNLTRMAAHTAVGFIVSSLGLLCLAWSDEFEPESWLPRWLPIPIAVAVITATVCLWQALSAAAIRIESHYPELASISKIATLMLVLGLMLAVAMAAVAYLAQYSARRAREVVRTNQALQEEIKVRTATEIALETHRDNLELLVAARTREVEQAREEAEAANRAKSEFLSHMSHELRTPLNGILGYTQILQRDERLDAGQHDSVNAIFNCGDHLLSLINDVLDLAKIEAGRMEVDEAPLDLAHLLQGVRDMVRPRAEAKGLEFRVQVDSGVPPRIISDAAKLRQILVNLLGNAVKFTASGSVQLGVDEEPRGILRCQVADTGVGIASDEIEAIFDPFKQVEAGKAAGGTGLGLAITRSLVDALRGTLDVQSEPGRGSTFTIVLPLTEAPTDVTVPCDDQDPAMQECRALAPGQNVTVLVADDRVTNRDVLEKMLGAAGFRTLLASDGDEALDVLHGHPEVDLLLLDMRMPRVDGREALRRIREDASLKSLKVIAVTASVFPEFRDKAIRAGFDDYLAKPFRIETLLSRLEAHLDLQLVATRPAREGSTLEKSASPDTDGGAIPDPLRARLRDAVRIKNLTAIKSVARELADDASTAAMGAKIEALVRAFDFNGLQDLVHEEE